MTPLNTHGSLADELRQLLGEMRVNGNTPIFYCSWPIATLEKVDRYVLRITHLGIGGIGDCNYPIQVFPQLLANLQATPPDWKNHDYADFGALSPRAFKFPN